MQTKIPNPILTKLRRFSVIMEHLQGGKIYTILILACCIVRIRSCNLNKCKVEHNTVSGEKIKQSAAYGRFKRVFQTGKGDEIHKSIFLVILPLIYPYIGNLLIVDRTEFTIGDQWVNLLVYGIECRGVLIPLVWKDLGKRKSSSQKERLALLDQLLSWWRYTKFPMPTLTLLGDREFIGQVWLKALEHRKINFVIRLKGNLRFKVWYKGQLKDRKIRLKTLERYMSKKGLNTMEIVIHDELIFNFVIFPNKDYDVNASKTKKGNDKYVYLVTNLADLSTIEQLYRKRWQIECCFKHLKSNGFNLESTALQHKHKIDILFSILTLVYTLAILEGIIKNYEENVSEKKYANGKVYKEKSLFVFGFEILKPKIDNFKLFIQHFKHTIIQCLKHFKYFNYSYI